MKNSHVSSNKCVKNMALKQPNYKSQPFITQTNAMIERVNKVVNDMLRLFDLENENNHEIIHLITSFNQIHGLLEAPIIQQCRQHHVNLCLAEIWSTILPSEQTGIKYKNENRALSIIPIKMKTTAVVEFLMNIRLETKCY
jgi:hypothetical protein